MRDKPKPDDLPTDTTIERRVTSPGIASAYDDMRASPGILLDPDGNVIFDGEAG
jgi:hypothetical protein